MSRTANAGVVLLLVATADYQLYDCHNEILAGTESNEATWQNKCICCFILACHVLEHNMSGSPVNLAAGSVSVKRKCLFCRCSIEVLDMAVC